MKKTVFLALLTVALVVLPVSGAMADKLLCVSHQHLKGEASVKQCLNQGMEFAIVEPNGFVRILNSREIELTKKINPKAFETSAFGLTYYHMAPDIPPLPVSPEVQ
ncbi:MAG: succinylglutamate desuccinylase [Thermodesulfobacteriota bacterium]